MKETKLHVLALIIAILGPLINFWVKPFYGSFIINSYVYWVVALSIYIGILIPFIKKSLITLVRMTIFGITAEDFFSNIWKSVFTGRQFLPFCNWYADYFPLFNILGEPTPLILVPKWYFLALFAYILLTAVQYRKQLPVKLKSLKDHMAKKYKKFKA